MNNFHVDLTLQLKKAEDRITELKAENDELKERVAMLDVTAVYKSLGEMGYIEQVDRLTARIAELEAERRWIPVSERMPDDWESVLTVDISKSTQDVVSAFYNPETSLWSTPFSSGLWVTHWMPLPESPIVYGKVCEE